MRGIVPIENYVRNADNLDGQKQVLRQWLEVLDTGEVTCECKNTMLAAAAYRCFYCGQYFCADCAERHFGKTLLKHRNDKRNEQPDT